jgi:hypothetical protein
MARAIRSGQPYQILLDPPLVDARVAHSEQTTMEPKDMSDEEVSFDAWLKGALTSNDGIYRHRHLDEEITLRPEILPHLKQIVNEAHEDARKRLRDIEGVSLDPLEIPTGQDPAEGYPERLPTTTLMGYFGEILAGIICENFAPLEETRWKVPAHLFRFHLEAFRHLEQLGQGGIDQNHQIFGRTGDDCLAFVLDEDGTVIRAMFCEAKCLNRHDSRKVDEAHRKLTDAVLKPLDRQQLIEVLLDNDDPESAVWVEALRKLRFQSSDSDYERCDLICYVCRKPQRKIGVWIPRAKPHPDYRAKRRLEAVEVCICEVRQLVKEVYEKDDKTNGP